MGIPHLAGYLEPFSDRITIGHTLHDPAKGAYESAIPSSKFIVDGPGLAYHICYRLCANRSGSINPLDAIPTYRDIGRHVIIFLDALEAYGHKM